MTYNVFGGTLSLTQSIGLALALSGLLGLGLDVFWSHVRLTFSDVPITEIDFAID